MKDYLKIFFLQLIVFYYIYPQALDTFGSSFIILPGVIGLGLYAYHGFPFKEVIYVVLAYLPFAFMAFLAAYLNSINDEFLMSYSRSQIAWFFSAYLIVFLLFKIHKNPTPITIAAYIVGATAIQSVCTLLIEFSPEALEFFTSLEMQSEITQEVRDEVEGTRLIGYGIGFFGAGLIAGYGLICTIFVLSRAKLNKKSILFLTIVYVFIFYIGIFMARTTVVGAAASLVLLFIYYMKDYKSFKSRLSTFIVSFVCLLIVGSSLCYVYFPSMANWAFELFINLSRKGELATSSSGGLEEMFYFPDDFRTFIFGKGDFTFAGSDVGYTRVAHYCGVIGMIFYYCYALFVAKISFTKNWHTNILLLLTVVYGWVINIKGFTDMHIFLYLFFFYFMYYKYYRFQPKVYVQYLKRDN